MGEISLGGGFGFIVISKGGGNGVWVVWLVRRTRAGVAVSTFGGRCEYVHVSSL